MTVMVVHELRCILLHPRSMAGRAARIPPKLSNSVDIVVLRRPIWVRVMDLKERRRIILYRHLMGV